MCKIALKESLPLCNDGWLCFVYTEQMFFLPSTKLDADEYILGQSRTCPSYKQSYFALTGVADMCGVIFGVAECRFYLLCA